jgi:OOP family OmpA-OmpF porin
MKKLLIGALSGSLMLGAAHAAGRVDYQPDEPLGSKSTGFYLGASLGQANSSLNTTLDKSTDVAAGVDFGVRFNRNFAVELDYLDLGKVTQLPTNDGKTHAFGATAVATASLSHSISVYGKFGVANTSTSWSVAPSSGVSTSQSKTGLTYGAGLSFDASREIELRVGLDRYAVGDSNGVNGNTNVVYAGVNFKF